MSTVSSLVLVLCSMMLIACGGSDDGDVELDLFARGTVTGSLAKGPIRHARFNIYRIEDGRVSDIRSGFGATDSTGFFSEKFEFHYWYTAEPVALVMEHGADTDPTARMVCDFYPRCRPYGGYGNAFGENTWLSGISRFDFESERIALKAYIPSFEPNVSRRVNISVLTTLAAAMADGAEELSNTSIAAAKDRLEQSLGLAQRGIDIFDTPLIDLTDMNAWVQADDRERYHSVMNAAIIGMGQRQNAGARIVAGLSESYESYIVTLARLIEDLRADGEFGGDMSRYHYAGVYQLSFQGASIPGIATISGAVNHQGYLSTATISGRSTFDEMLFVVKDFFGVGKIRGQFNTNRARTDLTGGTIDAEVDENGVITGRLRGNLSATITGQAILNGNQNYTPNSNAAISLGDYVAVAERQLEELHRLHGTE